MLANPAWHEEKLTPFEQDSRLKASGMTRFRDRRARLNTCGQCGIVRRFHREEVSLGRCSGFRVMSEREWAEWCGVGGKPEPPRRQRYEVRYLDAGGVDRVAGWTDAEGGGILLETTHRIGQPGSAYVVDLGEQRRGA